MAKVVYRPKTARYVVQVKHKQELCDDCSNDWVSHSEFFVLDKAKDFADQYATDNPEYIVRVIDRNDE